MQSIPLPAQPGAEMIQTLSMVLIIFGTAVAALAIPLVRSRIGGQFDSISDFFFGDRKTAAVKSEKTGQDTSSTSAPQASATTRREIDNFDLDLFKDF